MHLRGKLLSTRLLLSAVLVVATVSFAFQTRTASAAQITVRSLTLQTGAGGDGGSKPSGIVKHQFVFTLPNVGAPNVGSIKFEYCTLASGTCVAPTGLSTTVTPVTLGTSTGAVFTSVVNPSANVSYVSRTAASIPAGTSLTQQLVGIRNPSAINTTFFARISSYASTDTTGSAIDTGTVTASTATQIVLTGTMPESLIFCTGAQVLTTSGVPDCSTATSGAISFNQLFSPSDTATATSQMAASTNAGAGYSITVAGTTLTSGGNTITAMGSPGIGVRSSGQFGLNLKLNTTATSTPAIGLEVAPVANGTNYKGQAATGYNTADTFKFVSGNSVADSSNGGAGGSDAQIFTVSYIVNVPGSQPAGTYTTTLTYVCTATF